MTTLTYTVGQIEEIKVLLAEMQTPAMKFSEEENPESAVFLKYDILANTIKIWRILKNPSAVSGT